MSGGPDVATLKKAARWCRAQYARRRPDRRYEHPSFLATELLKEADKRYTLDSFGVEGWAESTQEGVDYLNMADSYTLTLLAISDRSSATFKVSSWGDWVESHQNEANEAQ